MAQFSHPSPRSISEEITPLDHQVLYSGGTSSQIERLPSRLQQSKSVPSKQPQTQVKELMYEVKYLEGELALNEDSREALLRFQEKIFKVFSVIEDASADAKIRVGQSEQRYVNDISILNRRGEYFTATSS